ncbi:hypothetical protein [Aquimarina intermedia]|uniref:Uncharacterized protein n=1 Tax=Aquimarina intermedia TaxID=350814 RepID=A0A5S5CF51_9FLAO|nr:hypothetical protein [Aquimarina intermedia]TYP76980.1 hypothetical protein BD809_101126 [Aquimarina intermedia]
MNYVDDQNFIKIMQYLEAYGYHDDAIKSIKARSAVATVTLHQQPNNKLLVYPYLKKAYEQGNLEAEKFSFVLNRMHINKFGKSYIHARTEEQNIVELLDILGLE